MPANRDTTAVPPGGANAPRRVLRLLAAVAVFGALAVVHVILLMRYWPCGGHDFTYFVPRLFDVALHYAENGVSVQYWTPSFGGGLPAFANPQHTQFMPAQFLTGLFPPYQAIIVSSVMLNTLGGLLVARFCLTRLQLLWSVSLIAGAAFAANGFFLLHVLVGHVSMTTFPLLAVVPLLLANDVRRSVAIGGLGLLWAALIYTGGYAICPISGLSLLLVVTLLAAVRPGQFSLMEGITRAAGGVILGALSSLGKLAAMAAWLSHYHSHGVYPNGPVGAELVNILLRLGPWDGLMLAGLVDPTLVSSLGLRLANGEEPLLWEHIQGVSIVVWLAVIAAIPLAVRRLRHWGLRQALPLMAAVWLTVEICIARGPIWSVLSRLPLLSWLHSNSRFDSSFILPLVLLGALALDALLRCRPSRIAAVIVAAALVFIPTAQLRYVVLVKDWYFRNYDMAAIDAAWRAHLAQPGAFSPVVRVADVSDEEAVRNRASSLRVYEPVFGYGVPGAQFRTTLIPGAVRDRGRYNIHQPLAFLSPALAQTDAFGPAPAGDRRVDDFLARRQPDWPLPRAIVWGNRVALLGLALCLGLVLRGGLGARRNVSRPGGTAPD